MACRVLVVDDSALVRRVLRRALAGVPGIEVVGEAEDPYAARDRILALEPDVITLDLEMPRMDGLTFLRKLMRYHPLPVVVVSSLTPAGSDVALQALREGAVEVVCKPGGGRSLDDLAEELGDKLRAAAAARVSAHAHPDTAVYRPRRSARRPRGRQVIALGASTGGTVAIERILRALPPNLPPVLVVQHMPAGFTTSFARRLDSLCTLRVREAEDGGAAEPGTVLVAPGDRHLRLSCPGGRYRVVLGDDGPVNRQRPSVDVLFDSLAGLAGGDAVGVILTGMGADGAAGLAAMRAAGATTLAQDEGSSVVFGMPRAAIERGAAQQVASLDELAGHILAAVRRQP